MPETPKSSRDIFATYMSFMSDILLINGQIYAHKLEGPAKKDFPYQLMRHYLDQLPNPLTKFKSIRNKFAITKWN